MKRIFVIVPEESIKCYYKYCKWQYNGKMISLEEYKKEIYDYDGEDNGKDIEEISKKYEQKKIRIMDKIIGNRLREEFNWSNDDVEFVYSNLCDINWSERGHNKPPRNSADFYIIGTKLRIMSDCDVIFSFSDCNYDKNNIELIRLSEKFSHQPIIRLKEPSIFSVIK